MHAFDCLRFNLHCRPGLFCSVYQYRRQHPNQAIKYFLHRRLGASPGQTIRGLAVEPILEHIHIDTAHLNCTKIVNKRKNFIKDEALISLGYTGNQLLQLLHCPLINLEHIIVGDSLFIRVKIVNIAKQKSERISDFPVGILRPSY